MYHAASKGISIVGPTSGSQIHYPVEETGGEIKTGERKSREEQPATVIVGKNLRDKQKCEVSSEGNETSMWSRGRITNVGA